jgi:hypothetical protein
MIIFVVFNLRIYHDEKTPLPCRYCLSERAALAGTENLYPVIARRPDTGNRVD